MGNISKLDDVLELKSAVQKFLGEECEVRVTCPMYCSHLFDGTVLLKYSRSLFGYLRSCVMGHRPLLCLRVSVFENLLTRYRFCAGLLLEADLKPDLKPEPAVTKLDGVMMVGSKLGNCIEKYGYDNVCLSSSSVTLSETWDRNFRENSVARTVFVPLSDNPSELRRRNRVVMSVQNSGFQKQLLPTTCSAGWFKVKVKQPLPQKCRLSFMVFVTRCSNIELVVRDLILWWRSVKAKRLALRRRLAKMVLNRFVFNHVRVQRLRCQLLDFFQQKRRQRLLRKILTAMLDLQHQKRLARDRSRIWMKKNRAAEIHSGRQSLRRAFKKWKVLTWRWPVFADLRFQKRLVSTIRFKWFFFQRAKRRREWCEMTTRYHATRNQFHPELSLSVQKQSAIEYHSETQASGDADRIIRGRWKRKQEKKNGAFSGNCTSVNDHFKKPKRKRKNQKKASRKRERSEGDFERVAKSLLSSAFCAWRNLCSQKNQIFEFVRSHSDVPVRLWSNSQWSDLVGYTNTQSYRCAKLISMRVMELCYFLTVVNDMIETIRNNAVRPGSRIPPTDVFGPLTATSLKTLAFFCSRGYRFETQSSRSCFDPGVWVRILRKLVLCLNSAKLDVSVNEVLGDCDEHASPVLQFLRFVCDVVHQKAHSVLVLFEQELGRDFLQSVNTNRNVNDLQMRIMMVLMAVESNFEALGDEHHVHKVRFSVFTFHRSLTELCPWFGTYSIQSQKALWLVLGTISLYSHL